MEETKVAQQEKDEGLEEAEKQLDTFKRTGKFKGALLLLLLGLSFCHKLFNGSPINAVPCELPTPPDVPYNDLLTPAEHISEANGIKFNGPEMLVVTPDKQHMYTSLADGTIARLDKTTQTWHIVGDTGKDSRHMFKAKCGTGEKESASYCGRPLGMCIADAGKLGITEQLPSDAAKEILVAVDAYNGMYVIANPRAPGSASSALSMHRLHLPPFWAVGDSHQFRFLNSITTSPDGSALYFTESSHNTKYREYLHIVLSGVKDGRVLRWYKGEIYPIITDLQFPNGLAFRSTKNEDYLLVCSMYEVLRYKVTGGGNGTISLADENARNVVPGFCDNLNRYNQHIQGLPSDAKFFLGHPQVYKQPFSLTHAIAPYPWIRNLIASFVPHDYLTMFTFAYGIVSVLDENGKVIATLQDPTGNTAWLTSAVVFEDYLYLGSYRNQYLARLPLSHFTSTNMAKPHVEL